MVSTGAPGRDTLTAMRSDAATVSEYLDELDPTRRELMEAIRAAVLSGLDDGFEEGMQYGMIGWYVPHSRFPAGYHCDPKKPLPFVQLASQKRNVSLYLFCMYATPGAPERFQEAWKATGKRLDMGKSCVRIRKLEEAALDVITDTIRAIPLDAFVDQYVKTTGHGG